MRLRTARGNRTALGKNARSAVSTRHTNNRPAVDPDERSAVREVSRKEASLLNSMGGDSSNNAELKDGKCYYFSNCGTPSNCRSFSRAASIRKYASLTLSVYVRYHDIRMDTLCYQCYW